MTVYFLQSIEGGPIKIGKSKDIAIRLYQLQREANKQLKVLGVIEGYTDKEKELHSKFADFRLNGEWFSPSVELLAFIETHAEDSDIEVKFKPKITKSLPFRVANDRSSATVESRLIQIWNEKETKENRRITIREVSDQTGISRDVIGRLLNGKTNRFDSKVISPLCKFFGVKEGEPVPFLVFRRNRNSQQATAL